jgi:hypothetical protein
MKIDKEYRFQADLFRGLVADHFDAVIPHLNGRDITLVCASIRDFWSGERIRRAIDGTARHQKDR